MLTLKRTLPILSLALAAAFGLAQPSFTMAASPLPGTMIAEAPSLSRDGGLVVVELYISNGEYTPMLWSPGVGFRPVSGADLSTSYQLGALTGDGRILVGTESDTAKRWIDGVGVEPVPVPLGTVSSHAGAGSYDGSTIVGSFSTGSHERPFRWSAVTGPVELDRGPALTANATAVSDDGATVVGLISWDGTRGDACRWNAQGVRTDLRLSGALANESALPVAVSADGTVTLLRVSTRNDGQHALLWTPSGARDLGYVPTNRGSVVPMGLSADGSVAVGLTNGVGVPDAFIWDKVHGMRSLRDALVSVGLGPQLVGVELVRATGATVLPSGDTVVSGVARVGYDLRVFSATIPPEVSFDGLGDLAGGAANSASGALSADGETVVGYGTAADGIRAFVWNASRGMVDIGAGAPYAAGVSRDGTTVVGGGGIGDGYRWREDGSGRWLGTGAEANGVSADGRVTVGAATGPDNVLHAYRWNEGSTERYTTYIGTHVAPSRAVAASADGAVFVGATLPHTFGTTEYDARAFRWDAQGHQAYLGDLPGGRVESEARAVSADGSVIVGWSSAASGDEPFLWTANGGMRSLGLISGGTDARALAVSPNGDVVVGSYHRSGVQRAFVWDARNGMRDLQDLVVAGGGVQAAAWEFGSATGVTVDATGRVTIAGSGKNGNGDPEAFRAVLPARAYAPHI